MQEGAVVPRSLMPPVPPAGASSLNVRSDVHISESEQAQTGECFLVDGQLCGHALCG